MIDLRVTLAAVLLVSAMAFGAGWTVRGWKASSEALEAAQNAREALTLAEAEKNALAADLRAADDRFAQKLEESQHETNVLRDRVSAGPVRLLVAAKCPVAVPEAPAASGVDPEPRAELDPAARSAYFALRDGINVTEGKLQACQAELRLRVGPP